MALRRYRTLFLFGLLLVAGVVAWWVVMNQHGMADSDFFTFWLGAHLTGQGLDVYDPGVWAAGHTQFGSTWLENQYYVYPLPLAILQIPLGWLSLSSAAMGWVFFSILGIFVAVYLLRDSDYPLASLIFVLCGVYLNRSVLTTLRNGQLGASLLILLVVSLWLLSKRKESWDGIGLALLLLKPTVGLPLVGLIVLYLGLEKRVHSILSILVTTSILAVISLIVATRLGQIFPRVGLIQRRGRGCLHSHLVGNCRSHLPAI